jgi:hypothetical protein
MQEPILKPADEGVVKYVDAKRGTTKGLPDAAFAAHKSEEDCEHSERARGTRHAESKGHDDSPKDGGWLTHGDERQADPSEQRTGDSRQSTATSAWPASSRSAK